MAVWIHLNLGIEQIPNQLSAFEFQYFGASLSTWWLGSRVENTESDSGLGIKWNSWIRIRNHDNTARWCSWIFQKRHLLIKNVTAFLVVIAKWTILWPGKRSNTGLRKSSPWTWRLFPTLRPYIKRIRFRSNRKLSILLDLLFFRLQLSVTHPDFCKYICLFFSD